MPVPASLPVAVSLRSPACNGCRTGTWALGRHYCAPGPRLVMLHTPLQCISVSQYAFLTCCLVCAGCHDSCSMRLGKQLATRYGICSICCWNRHCAGGCHARAAGKISSVCNAALKANPLLCLAPCNVAVEHLGGNQFVPLAWSTSSLVYFIARCCNKALSNVKRDCRSVLFSPFHIFLMSSTGSVSGEKRRFACIWWDLDGSCYSDTAFQGQQSNR